MASWYERAVQTSFKPAAEGAEGYVFRCPNPWLFGVWRNYLVNEAQKEILATHLRQRQRLILRLLAVYLLVSLGLTILFQSWGSRPDASTNGFLALVAVALLGMLALALVPHLYLMRKIKPLLAQMPRTDAPTTLREQLFGVAAVISPLHLALGGLGGFLIAVANIKSIVEELSAGLAGSQLLWSGVGLLFGVGLASYFAYLAILRGRLKRKLN